MLLPLVLLLLLLLLYHKPQVKVCDFNLSCMVALPSLNLPLTS
jgi:hypothetical protein